VLPSSGSGLNSLGTLSQRQGEEAIRRGEDPAPFLETAAAAFGNAWKSRPRAALYQFNLHEVRCLQAEQALRRSENPATRIAEAESALGVARKLEGAEQLAAEFCLAESALQRLRAEAALLGGRSAEAGLAGALRNAREAVRLGPRNPAAWMELGRVWTLSLQAAADRPAAPREARRAFSRAAQLDPADPEIPLALARLDLLEGVRRIKARKDPSALLGSADRQTALALSLDPRRADAHGLRACLELALARRGEQSQPDRDRHARAAVELAASTLALNPSQAQALQVRAKAQALLGTPGALPEGLQKRFDPALEILLEAGGK
jgi:hypothetical protein